MFFGFLLEEVGVFESFLEAFLKFLLGQTAFGWSNFWIFRRGVRVLPPLSLFNVHQGFGHQVMLTLASKRLLNKPNLCSSRSFFGVKRNYGVSLKLQSFYNSVSTSMHLQTLFSPLIYVNLQKCENKANVFLCFSPHVTP